MNILKKDDGSTNAKLEKINSSDTECLKSSNDKIVDILTKTKILKNDIISKSSKNIKISTDNKDKEKSCLDDEDSFDENDDEIVKIEKKSIEITKTTAAEVLNLTKLDPKDNLNLLKFNICYLVRKEFNWEIYHTPEEVQKFFKKLYKFIIYDESAMKLVNLSSLEKIKDFSNDQLLNSIDIIKNEFDTLFKSSYFDNNLIINEFFTIGSSSFSQYNNGIKPYEGWAMKKADPHCMRKAFGYICFCLECCIFKKFNERWIVLKDDMISYSNLSNSPGGKHVYFFDEEIKAKRVGKLIIRVINLSRVLELKFKSFFERELWKIEMEKRITKFKNVVKFNRYKAYTNEKINNFAQWFIDGRDYFNDLYEKLMDARKSIFITDWWMSPEVWLKRPVIETDYTSFFKKNNMTRLMDVLEHKAKEGVKIYILLYYECSIAIKLNSKHTMDTLEKLHKNIVVTRHPTDKLDLLWSHHEKLVIIDQVIGYVGGLDLCWGRYDTSEHPIYEAPNSEKKYYYPFIDYSNARICDFVNVENYLVESVPRNTCLRMPWHDVHTRLIGPVVNDISRHFVERWNHARFDDRNKSSLNIKGGSHVVKSKKRSVILKKNGFLNSIIESVLKMEKDKIDSPKKSNEPEKKNTSSISDSFSDSLSIDLGDNNNIKIGKTPIFQTKDNALKSLNNPIVSHFRPKSKSSFNLNVTGYTRQWKTQQKSEKEQMVYQEKFETLKREWMENLNDLDEDIVPVRKKLENQIVSTSPPTPKKEGKKKSFYKNLISRLKKNKNNWFKDIFEVNNEIETIVNDKYIKKGSVSSTVQVLRSVGEWSMGLKVPENSILEAYYQLIDQAKYYIYIENQFFISKSFEDPNKPYLVENKIALHLVNRILKAYRNKEKFRVYVFLPLMPGFAGEPEKSGTLQIILKYTFETICRNQGLSIIERLVEEMEPNGDHWEDYIAFFSLRNHALVNGIPKTELIYIHSKLMIVDDNYVICGSANINDRSMKGPRDSEFCALIKEKRTEYVTINGRKTKISRFGSSLRKALLSEHLGINKHDVRLNDPISDELHKLIWETARNNTDLYRQIFMCYPDDYYTKFSMIPNKNSIQNKAQEYSLKKNYEEKKNQIIGHIVEFPLHFLEEEQLGISFFSKENLVPERNFT